MASHRRPPGSRLTKGPTDTLPMPLQLSQGQIDAYAADANSIAGTALPDRDRTTTLEMATTLRSFLRDEELLWIPSLLEEMASSGACRTHTSRGSRTGFRP
jgi:hypothetical protein